MNKKELIAIFQIIAKNDSLSKEDMIKLAQSVLDKEESKIKSFQIICEELDIIVDGRSMEDVEKEIISKSLIKFKKKSNKGFRVFKYWKSYTIS